LIELTVSNQNPFVGKNMGACCVEFAAKYKVGIISTRSRGQDAAAAGDAEAELEERGQRSGSQGSSSSSLGGRGSDEEAAGESTEFNATAAFKAAAHHTDSKSVVLAAGDMVLCLAKTSDIPELKSNRDFFVASTVGSVPPVMSYYGMIPVFVFLLMIISVATENIRMAPAALTATGLFFLGGWLVPADIPKMVDLRLLMLMGCSLSFAAAMQSSGLASTLAKLVIESVNPSPQGALYIIYILTLCVTELMSNNAAAALMYPISSAIAKELGVSVIPFALVVLVAATAAFMSPIGYQTHLMVWAPGGYKFTDFIKFGFFGDMLFWMLTCAIAPLLFPL
jgi:di/tricarboxylate transporter